MQSKHSKIVVLISGSGTNLQAIIDACKASNFPGEVVGVVSNKADAFGLTRAQNAEIATSTLSHKDFESRESYDQSLIKEIDTYQPDLVVLAGFMRILTAGFVQHFQGRLINIHPSLLPKYQGLHTHKRALEAGDNEHGVTVHFVTAELDGGPCAIQAIVPILAGDTEELLAARILQQEHIIYPMAVQWFAQRRLLMRDNVAFLDNEPLPATGHQVIAKEVTT